MTIGLLDPTNTLMPLAQQVAQTVPSAILPSYQETKQAVSPFLPLVAQQPGNTNGDNDPPSFYKQAGDHFKTGALPWVGDSGATKANTGLWYLTQALNQERQQEEVWRIRQFRQQEEMQLRLKVLENSVDALLNNNRSFENSVTAPSKVNTSNNLNLVG
jgi:hypothetical protein